MRIFCSLLPGKLKGQPGRLMAGTRESGLYVINTIFSRDYYACVLIRRGRVESKYGKVMRRSFRPGDRDS